MKRILIKFPEYYLVLLVLLCGYKPPFHISSLVLWIVVPLILQIIFKNKTIWVLIAGSFLAINLCMIPALISEFSEFPTFAKDAQQLLFGGSAIILLNIMICGVLLVNYTRESGRVIFNVLCLLTTGIYSLVSLAFSGRYPEHATSGILFYTGLALFILAGIIAIYRWYKKEEIPALHVQVS